MKMSNLRAAISKANAADAVSLIEQALPKHPGSQAELYFLLGEAQSASDQKAALAAYSKACELQPENPAYWGRQGALHASLNQQQQAADCFSKALQTSDTPPFWARIGLGNAFEKLGKYPETIAQFRAALLEKPDAVELRSRLIKIYQNQGLEHECLDLLEKQASEDTVPAKRIQALWKTAETALNRGQHPVAIKFCEQILTIDSTHKQAIESLKKAKAGPKKSIEQAKTAIVGLLNESRFDEARTQAGLLLEKYGDEPGALHLGAEVDFRAGAYPQAITLYRKLLEVDKNDIVATGRMAELMLKEGQVDPAIEFYRKTIQLSPEPLRWAYIGLGNALEAKGDLAGCIANFEKALELDRNSAGLSNRLNNLRNKLAAQTKPAAAPVAKQAAPTAIAAEKQGAAATKAIEPPATAVKSPAPKQERLRGYVCFLTNSNSWFFARKNQWFQLREQEHLATMLGAFSLKVFDGRSLNNIPCSGGYVSVSGTPGKGYAAEFHKATGELISTERIVLDESILTCAEWLYGAYDDKWIATSAEMSVEGAGNVEFTLFLPRNDQGKGKRVTIKLNGEVAFDETVERGKSFTLPMLKLDNDKPTHVISIQTDAAEQSPVNDRRVRGLVVTEVKLNGQPYTPILQ